VGDRDFHICQALTNHGRLNSYLFRFKIKDNAICDYCRAAEEDADHRIYDCPNFDTERDEMVSRVEEAGLEGPIAHKHFIKPNVFSYFYDFCLRVF
jgi:hypothetical protein